jgi:uncharacterized protein (TIGR02266 family)
MMKEELRKSPRIETDALVDYTGKNLLLYHNIQNISLGGISIQSPEIEKVGTEVELTINFPDLNETLELKGEVVWANMEIPKDMGIKFISLTDHDREVLRKYMELVRMNKG